LSNRGSVNIDNRTNQVFVTDVPSGLERVAEFIRRIDVPVSQVLIEARIVEAEDTFGRNLGVRFGGRASDPATVVGRGENRVQRSLAFGSIDATGSGNARVTNIPTPTFGSGVFAISLFNPSVTRLVNLEIEASESDQRLQTIASPRVITTNHNPAIIAQGVQLPFTTTGADGQTNTTFRDALLRLEVTPHVTPDGGVSLNVKVNKDSRGEETRNGPAINTRSVSTQVLVENGGTVVIGGIFETTESNVRDQVPGLGDIPVLGHLFRSTARQTVRRELLVFLTPQVLTAGAALR